MIRPHHATNVVPQAFSGLPSTYTLGQRAPRESPRVAPVMAMLRICSADGCETKTLGRYCLDHELGAVDAGDDLTDALKEAAVRTGYPAGSAGDSASPETR